MTASQRSAWAIWLHWIHRLLTVRPAALRDAMRNFFNSYWKVILAILVAILLAVLTVGDTYGEAPLAARLQAHAQSLGPDAQRSALRHIDTSLRRYGYAPLLQPAGAGERPGHTIEASLASRAPGSRPSRVFIVGARLRPDGNAGAAAILELARAVKDLRPAYGTEIRFVFFMSDESGDKMAVAGPRDGGNFMAFVGTRESSQRVRQALAALRSDPMLVRQGLAAPAHVMGLTLSGHGGHGDGPALVITDTGFLRFPYFHTQAPPGGAQAITHDRNDYDSMARVVSGLARTLSALAGAVQA